MAKQSELPDTRVYPSEILTAINQTRQAATVLSDKIFVLENLLEAVTDEA